MYVEGLLQPTHLLLILVVALLVFGPRRLPELGGAIGKTLREFKKATNESVEDNAGGPKQIEEKKG
jgi:sec-independent protein translocase protein TatA